MAKINNNDITYFAIAGLTMSPGVRSKIASSVSAANKLGFSGAAVFIQAAGVLSYLNLAMQVATAKARYILIRDVGYGGILLMISIVIARLRRRKIIVDVPTPRAIAVKEIASSPEGFLRRLVKIALIIVSGPWSLWPASRVIQHSEENAWFSFGNKRKTIKLGNGIDLSAVQMRRFKPSWPNDRLHVLGVGQLSRWHGYDRVILAISRFNARSDNSYAIQFTIVGDGPAKHDLQSLVTSLGLDQQVSFLGSLVGEALHRQYEVSHLAIDSLGLHRIGLDEAAPLKAREYCAVGIPFVSAAADPDFDGSERFRARVAQSDEISSIVDIFNHLDELLSVSIDEMREFAALRLDHSAKMNRTLGGL